MTVSSKPTTSPQHMRGHDLREIRKDRHSASPKSHCVADHAIKKEGRGGKYTWGSNLDTEGPASIDKGDPNYIEEDQSS